MDWLRICLIGVFVALVTIPSSPLPMFPSLSSIIEASIYVPNKYPTIQGAINHANPGDTIYVSPGIYHENVVINASVHLIGTGRASTLIDGQSQATVVMVNASNVEITGFTIANAGQGGRGILVNQVNNVNITENTISAAADGDGVQVNKSNYTFISDNNFVGNLFAVSMTFSGSGKISYNTVANNNLVGVQLLNSTRTLVERNNFFGGGGKGEDGVKLVGSLTIGNNMTANLIKGMKNEGVLLSGFPRNNTFNENNFQLDHIGVNLQNATLNTFYHNNFVASSYRHVNSQVPGGAQQNTWDNRTLGGIALGGNYWDNFTEKDSQDNGAGGRSANDGIFDTNLPSNGVDYYPLVAPFVPVPLAVNGIVFSPSGGSVPLTVVFGVNVLGSLKPFTYSWDFGDGSPADSSSNPTHTYTKPGNYSVSVIVKDASGAADLGRLSFTVLSPTPPSNNLVIFVGSLAVLVALVGAYYGRRRLRQRGREKSEGAVSLLYRLLKQPRYLVFKCLAQCRGSVG